MEPIDRNEFDEYQRRIDDFMERAKERMGTFEKGLDRMGEIAMSVQKLADAMEHMVKEQEKQGKRLESLESRDGEMWRKVTGYIATTIVGIVLGYIAVRLGLK